MRATPLLALLLVLSLAPVAGAQEPGSVSFGELLQRVRARRGVSRPTRPAPVHPPAPAPDPPDPDTFVPALPAFPSGEGEPVDPDELMSRFQETAGALQGRLRGRDLGTAVPLQGGGGGGGGLPASLSGLLRQLQQGAAGGGGGGLSVPDPKGGASNVSAMLNTLRTVFQGLGSMGQDTSGLLRQLDAVAPRIQHLAGLQERAREEEARNGRASPATVREIQAAGDELRPVLQGMVGDLQTRMGAAMESNPYLKGLRGMLGGFGGSAGP